MKKKDTLDFRFLASPAVIDDLQRELMKHNDIVNITGSKIVTDATDLSFDLGDVKELVTLIPPAILAGKVIINVFRNIIKKHPKGTHFVIESPLGKVDFETQSDMSEEEIRVTLRKLTEL